MISKPSGASPDVLVDPSPAPAVLAMRLCNFATGSSALLPDHQAELSSRILQAIWPYSGGWIDIVGYASKLGAADRNMQLSLSRCEAVRQFLAPHLTVLGQPFRFNVTTGRGEEDSQDDPSGNDGFYRAVTVKLFAQGRYRWDPPQPAPKPQPTPLEPAEFFQFIPVQVTSGSLSYYQLDMVEFGIRDLRNSRTRYFRYTSVLGVDFPVPYTPPVGASVGRMGVPKGFRTAIPINDFEKFASNDASLLQRPGGAIGTDSLGGRCTLQWAPKAYSERSVPGTIRVEFSTAKGIGVSGGSYSRGAIQKLPDSHQPRRFPGEHW